MSSVGISDAHQLAAEAIQNKLNAGMNVAFLTLSDPGFYSTFSYILGIVAQNGYEVKTVSGVPSFCAASARLNLSLAHGEESVLISSGEFHNFSGTQVILKAGKHLKTLKQTLSSTGKTAYLIENCGMENERIYVGADSFPDETGYLSILIIM
jgi:precorrin-2/cobalt-factor-2 C20-methyltransferase